MIIVATACTAFGKIGSGYFPIFSMLSASSEILELPTHLKDIAAIISDKPARTAVPAINRPVN
ncbi:hypothetical protein D3C85_1924900 [compost metagenome]